MPPLLLTDDDVRARLGPGRAVEAVRAALLAHHAGRLHAPARLHADLGGGDVVITAGRLADQGVHGFRAYDTVAGGEQLTALWDSASGELRALVVGVELGARRTGAIGALAVDAAARPDAVRLGLLGAGTQAWTQLWALTALRGFREVVVAARHPERAAAFADRARRELGVAARAAADAEDAVRGSDVVIAATSSTVPVLEDSWVAPGAHVSTLGAKLTTGAELPASLVARADVLLTDSLAQSAGYGPRALFDPAELTELSAVLAGAVPARTAAGQLTVFSSVGLAGTEPALAAALLDA